MRLNKAMRNSNTAGGRNRPVNRGKLAIVLALAVLFTVLTMLSGCVGPGANQTDLRWKYHECFNQPPFFTRPPASECAKIRRDPRTPGY